MCVWCVCVCVFSYDSFTHFTPFSITENTISTMCGRNFIPLKSIILVSTLSLSLTHTHTFPLRCHTVFFGILSLSLSIYICITLSGPYERGQFASRAYILVFKLHTLKLTKRQLMKLLNDEGNMFCPHPHSPFFFLMTPNPAL